MKKSIRIFTITVATILLYNNANGQLIENGDFLHDHLDLVTEWCPDISGKSFPDGYVTNWYRMHGSPELCGFSSYCAPGHTGIIYMEDYQRVGEGIVGGYNFKKDETYLIHLGVINVVNDQDINMLAVSGSRPFNGDCIEIPCGPFQGNFHGKVPTAVPNNGEFVLDPRRSIGASSLSVGDNFFTYTPTSDKNWITIFPFGLGNDCPFTSITIDYLWITRQCKEYKNISNYPQNSYNSEPYFTSYYKSIHVGTAAGNTNLVYPHGYTSILTATEEITIEKSFRATPRTGNFFLAQIDPYNCDRFPQLENNSSARVQATENVQEGYSTQSHTSKLIPQSEQERNKVINNKTPSIHPNPTTGSFNVTMQQAGNYNIRVMNMMGAMVYETQLNGEQQKSVQLNQSLPAGTYTIQVSGEGQMHVEKLILIK